MPAPSRILRHLALALPLIATLGACSTWSRRPAPTRPHEQFRTGPVRVTRTDGSTIVLDRVTIGADSVIGRDHARPHARVAIPASDVRRVEARRVDPLRTSAVLILSLGAVVAVWAAFLVHTDAGVY
jgi:hypothetical protein